MIAILYATDGQVTPNDWLSPAALALRPEADPRQAGLFPTPSTARAAA